MPVVRAAVILMAYPAGQSLNLKMDVSAYVQYFFNPDYGHKAYWLKQTDNDLLFDGAVFDWRVHTEPNPNLGNRTTVAQEAVNIMQSEYGVDFSPFDVVIVVLGINPSIPSDGGSIGVQSEHRSHHAIVARVGDRFDFMAHEIGHAFDIQHSFGSILFQTSGEGPGGYAHPYCIMSAMAYGNLAAPYFPSPPRNSWPEYAPLGPSLNAVTALGRGWIHAHSFVMPGSNTQEFVLRSRHAGGRDLGRPPQAVEVRAANGDTFVIEYREDTADGWDRGQGAPLLIVAQGRGGTGEKAKPGKFSGTYLAKRSLPVVLGGFGHMYQGPGFGFVILDRSVLDHTVRIRLSPGNVQVPTVSAASTLTMDRSVVEQGETTWEPGEKLCYQGTWRYTKCAQSQTWTFEVTCNDAAPPLAAVWTVEGTVLTTSPQTVTVSKTVTVANPKMDSVIVNQFVSIVCEIENLPNGSRLKARNTPNHETYGFSVQVTLSSSIGACTESFSEKFTGMVYDYGPEFVVALAKCWRKFADVNQKYLEFRIVLEPDLWKTIPVREREIVTTYLDVLSILRSNRELGDYERALADLPAVIGAEYRQLTTFALDDRFEVPFIDGILDQPSPPYEALLDAAARESEARRRTI